MKSFLLFLISLSTLFAEAQDRNIEAIMLKNISNMDSCFHKTESTVCLAKRFEQIANLEKGNWLPLYYASYCYSISAYMQQDPLKIDETLDRADSLLNLTIDYVKSNSEISCLRSLIASARIIVNPMQRGMKYGQLVSQMIEKAKKEDPSNPRPYYLQALSLMYTPEQYGGGCNNARPLLKIAIDKFNKFIPESKIHPTWGKEKAIQLLKRCK